MGSKRRVKEPSLDMVKREVRRNDPNLKDNDSAFVSAVILLSSAIVGPNMRKLARFTGYKLADVAQRGYRLRKNGIWVGRGVDCGEWSAPKSGGIAFWLHVAVAEGHVMRGAAIAK
jgi:hypothetical protein